MKSESEGRRVREGVAWKVKKKTRAQKPREKAKTIAEEEGEGGEGG